MNRSPIGQAKEQLREPGSYELSTGLAPEPRGHMTGLDNGMGLAIGWRQSPVDHHYGASRSQFLFRGDNRLSCASFGLTT